MHAPEGPDGAAEPDYFAAGVRQEKFSFELMPDFLAERLDLLRGCGGSLLKNRVVVRTDPSGRLAARGDFAFAHVGELETAAAKIGDGAVAEGKTPERGLGAQQGFLQAAENTN